MDAEQAARGKRWVWVAKAAFAAVLVTAGCYAVLASAAGTWGFVDVKATQVGVKFDYRTGALELIERPGYQVYVPWMQEVFLLDKRPIPFVMSGDVRRGANQVPFLMVRSRDGSNFWFESLEIQYRLRPSAAPLVLEDSGVADAYKRKWLRTYARAVLRDEFGKYRAEEIADPTRYQEAKRQSRLRINGLLAAHGLELVQITTPKPRFDPDYEKAIANRKVADQEVERLAGELQELGKEREMLLAVAERDLGIEREKLKGKLATQLLELQGKDRRYRAEAEAYAAGRREKSAARQASLLADAEVIAARGSDQAESLLAEVMALEERGVEAVREALVKRLGQVEFKLEPFARERSEER